MLILVAGIFYTWFAYKKAKQKGRSKLLWAAIAAATFLGTQIIVASGFGFVIALGISQWGWSESLFYRYGLYITIVGLFASILTNWLALRPLNKVPDKAINEPPPPPRFESSEN